jgi:hypothetical protein
MLWAVDLLLGGDRGIGDYTAAVASQGTTNNFRGIVFSAQCAVQQLKSIRERVFSVWSLPRCYKQDN